MRPESKDSVSFGPLKSIQIELDKLPSGAENDFDFGNFGVAAMNSE